jgi:hypothetical protein
MFPDKFDDFDEEQVNKLLGFLNPKKMIKLKNRLQTRKTKKCLEVKPERVLMSGSKIIQCTKL